MQTVLLSRGTGYIGEFGHMIVDPREGRSCPCGQSGCWEQYASVGALVRLSETAAINNPDSYIAKIYREKKKLNGKLIFDAIDNDCSVAQGVFDEYLEWLAVGIKSIKMMFNPEAIVLSGGITRRGDKLLKPLTINSWNEWTETSYLQPDDIFGYGYLEAVKNVFVDK